MCTVAICLVAVFFEHNNETLGSVIWLNLLIICVTKYSLMSSGIKFYFKFLHTCKIHPDLLSAALYVVFVCNFFFRELFRLMMAGSGGFGPARDAILMEMVRVTVRLVTAVTNWSAMGPEVYHRSPWLR